MGTNSVSGTAAVELSVFEHRFVASRPPARRWGWKWLYALLPPICLVVFAYIASGAAIGDHAMWRTITDHPQAHGLSSRVVTFTSYDGIPLTAWWIVPVGPASATVVLAHGSEGNRGYMLPKTAGLVALGYNVLTVDLRAHGDSGGSYMTSGYMEARDLIGAVKFLRDQGYRGPIVVMGYSYGAIAAMHAGGQRDDIAGVIADSPYISTHDLMVRGSRYARHKASIPLEVKFASTLASLPVFDRMTRLIYRLRTGVEIDPPGSSGLDAARALKHPYVLFLTDASDTAAPTANVNQMYEVTPSTHKYLAVFPPAGGEQHDPFVMHYQAYFEAIRKFVATIRDSQPTAVTAGR